MKKKIFALIMLFVVLLQFNVSADAPYKSYVYDIRGFYSLAPDAFQYDSTIDLSALKDENDNPLGELNNPSDVYVSYDNLIYISDTDNKRVIVLNSDYSLNRVIGTFTSVIKDENGNEVKISDEFTSPTSVFVDKNNDGNIYVCDKNGLMLQNCDADKKDSVVEGTSGRVVQFDKNGNFVRQIYGVESPVLPDDFIFQPTDIVLDSAGGMFILSYSFNMGVVELDEFGEFVQCLGAPEVTYNPIELIWRKLSTDEQKERSQSFVPTEYSGIDIDDDGFVYVTNKDFKKTTANSVDKLSKLNAKGKDVLRKETMEPFGDTKAAWLGTYKGPSRLTDVITMDYGMYAVLDELRGKVFFYNSDGVNLFEFGTMPDIGDDIHTTYPNGVQPAATAIAWHNDSCLVLDTELKNINVYSMTDYAKLISKANMYHESDKYDEEIECWNDVLKLNANSNAAKRSIAKVYYRNGDYDTAMKYFKSIYDQENYSKAYKYERQIVIEKYFGVGVGVIVGLIILIAVLKRVRKKYLPPIKKGSYLAHLKYANTVMARPLNGSWFLVRENNSSVASATTILAAASIMSLLQARFTGFIFNMDGESVNIFLEVLKIVAPLLLFCVCNWCVTSLLNGEGNFKSIYIASCYSLTPILYLYPFAIILSNIMVKEEGDFYSVFITVAMIYVVILLIASNMRIHDYSLGMTMVELLITVIVMLLVVFLAILFFALCQQMFDFVSSIIEELSLRS